MYQLVLSVQRFKEIGHVRSIYRIFYYFAFVDVVGFLVCVFTLLLSWAS
jgi:hypothetical protein